MTRGRDLTPGSNRAIGCGPGRQVWPLRCQRILSIIELSRKVTILARKTEHQNKPYRVIPTFPELRPHLEAAFRSQGGAIYAVSQNQESTQNLRALFFRILRRARVQPWEHLFHNLRGSRQTELADQFPLHVVTDWIGNSPDIADRHYLKTTDDHFKKSVAGETAHGTGKAAQNPAQQAAVRDQIDPQTQRASSSKDEALLAPGCGQITIGSQLKKVPPRGVEPRFSG